MTIKFTCDACGHPINSFTRANPNVPAPHAGQLLSVTVSVDPSNRPYVLDLHHDCAARILKAIGRERTAIADEAFKPTM